MTVTLRPEAPDDAEAIEAVTVAAFANAPHTGHTEQFIVRALRAGDELTVSVVADDDGAVVGHVAVSPVTITDPAGGHVGDWYGLGPISVLPARQGTGIGAQLMERALTDLRDRGAAGCVLLGDPDYYTRFGFTRHPNLRLPGVPAEYFLALPLSTPAPTGTVPTGIVAYSDAFDATS